MKSKGKRFSSIPPKNKLIQWASQFDPCVILDSHTENNPDYPGGHTYDLIIGVGKKEEIVCCQNSFESLQAFHDTHKQWMLGYLGYDLKNELEDLSSENEDHYDLPQLRFFIPQTLITIQNGELFILEAEGNEDEIMEDITNCVPTEDYQIPQVNIRPRIHHAEYIKGVKSLLHHIQMGDIYEANFCQEFYANEIDLQPIHLYSLLTQTSPTPFATYAHFDNFHLMSASPERYIKKEGTKIISQPIKGTAKRSDNPHEDAQLKHDLSQSKKDRSENVMIVDLVRNDLSRSAIQNSVHVKELFGIYSFSNVHQMISTIGSEVSKETPFTHIIRDSFPMGSMTGAPKIKAMELIEQFEHTKRGIYSGAVGYITPEGDFDFNVVIRSLQYNADSKYLSYMVGGAITQNSDPEGEYHECEIKAASIKKVLNS